MELRLYSMRNWLNFCMEKLNPDEPLHLSGQIPN